MFVTADHPKKFEVVNLRRPHALELFTRK